MYKSPAQSFRDDLCASDDVQLCRNAFEMRFHRHLADKERFSNFFVAFALSKERENFHLPGGRRISAQPPSKLGGNRGREARFASVHLANAVEQHLTPGVLKQISFGTSLYGAIDVFIGIVRG